MKWQGRSGSTNIEDRRGMRMGLPLGGGIGGIVLLLLYSALTGQNPIDIVGSVAPTEESAPAGGVPADDPQAQFISVVLRDTEETWDQVFREHNSRYEPPTLVLFRDATQSACGVGQSAMGPFYCPGDQKVYLDLSFFQELSRRFGAPGDFAAAYVIAHEIGHHVQSELGIEDAIRRKQQDDPGNANVYSVQLELQADCFAGVWGKSTANRGLLDPGDIDEGLKAAAAVGDDRLGARGREQWTHGSSQLRVQWFRTGYDSGNPSDCDTSNVEI
jgi:hypothetical protein